MKSTQRCEGSEVKNHALILHKSIPDQGTLTRSYWRHDRRCIISNDHPEWTSKRLGIFHLRNMLQKKTDQVPNLLEECVQE